MKFYRRKLIAVFCTIILFITFQNQAIYAQTIEKSNIGKNYSVSTKLSSNESDFIKRRVPSSSKVELIASNIQKEIDNNELNFKPDDEIRVIVEFDQVATLQSLQTQGKSLSEVNTNGY